jgi:NADP-dependent 3-hydroxy acid dehydrogenase YdfG
MTSEKNSRALITGAGSGIGKATALAFAEVGIDVALVSRSIEKLEQVAAEVCQKGAQAKIYPLDLAEIDQVRTKMGAIADEFCPDILINNAGMGYTGDLLTTPLADWQRVMDLNLTSVLQCIQGVLPHMRDRHRGTIINVASIAGYQAFPNWGAYCVSKAGLLTLSKVLAAEERPHGIRVMTISPGAVNTPIWDTDTVQADFDRSQMMTPDVIAQSIVYAASLPDQAVIQELTIMPSAGAL